MSFAPVLHHDSEQAGNWCWPPPELDDDALSDIEAETEQNTIISSSEPVDNVDDIISSQDLAIVTMYLNDLGEKIQNLRNVVCKNTATDSCIKDENADDSSLVEEVKRTAVKQLIKLKIKEFAVREKLLDMPPGSHRDSDVGELDSNLHSVKERRKSSGMDGSRNSSSILCGVSLPSKLASSPDQYSPCVSSYHFDSMGHKFVRYPFSSNSLTSIPVGLAKSRSIYCQLCTFNIWVYIQSAWHCNNCGYSIHTTCLRSRDDQIPRRCVHEKVVSSPDFITDIRPQVKLSDQHFKCSECKVRFKPQKSMPSGRSLDQNVARLCDYTGLYFCGLCHWSSKSDIPARIILNWDFKLYPVCQSAKQYLYLMYDKPIINVESVNNKLFAMVPELAEIREQRKLIVQVVEYLQICRLSSQEQLIKRELSLLQMHYVESADFYSLSDLHDVNSNFEQTLKNLKSIVSEFTDHVQNCVICKGNGHICQICKVSQIIFPFDRSDLVVKCEDCHSIYHKMCFVGPSSSKDDGRDEKSNCVKCHRLKSTSE